MKKGWRTLVTIIGLCLVSFFIWQLDPFIVLSYLVKMGWLAPFILLPYGFLFIFDSIGWQLTLSHPPSLKRLYAIRLMGEAVNNITPTASLGGEPLKAAVLKNDGIPMTQGLGSVLLAKTTMTLSQAAFIFSGTVIMAVSTGYIQAAIGIVCVVALLGLICAIGISWQKHGVFASLFKLFQKLHIRSKWLESKKDRFLEVDHIIHQFITHNPLQFWKSSLAFLIGWILGAAEVYIICSLMHVEISWLQAYMIESLSQFSKILGLFIPGALGIHEAGGIVIFRILGLTETAGLTLILLKRVREIIYTLIGFFLLSFEKGMVRSGGRTNQI